MNIRTEYDRLYAEAEAILKEHNPCAICPNSKGGMNCNGMEKGRRFRNPSFCCKGFGHLKNGTCTVKSLACKVWVCRGAGLKNPEALSKLRAIAQEAISLGIFLVRGSKRKALANIDPSRPIPSFATMTEGAYGW